ncbi:pathogenesis-related homeodomain protein isoform X2 [Cornus florida]|uniref:pathogenesis-related homeodomain protein isoform X2 n=1 Tax=Cornus florida TaxID=4283 RepID=UPI00289F30D9|nr:pathogenesis-related homeodomain protein isoform X2 [Cornus florida]
MRGTRKKLSHKEFGKSCLNKIQNPKSKPSENDIGSAISHKKDIIYVSKGRRNDPAGRNVISKETHQSKSSKKQSELRHQGEKAPAISSMENEKHADDDVKSQKLKKRRKRKRQKDNVELDEAPRLQRRTRYLLIKMKLEQNLIDAYSGEGWKGQSREKIKPEKELQRAKKQILKCKLGIREAIRQLDLLSSVGCIEGSAIAPDGSVYHEHIVCAKCKLREAFPDNDIILCDGTCNCAFHQKCLDPPLLTENRDQGWFCKFCECKMEIIEAMNAHIGTHFSTGSNWQDIFKDEAALPDGGGALMDPEQEWPSEDSEDDDYDPERIENSCSCNRAGSEGDVSDDASSSSSSWSLEDEVFSESGRSAKRSKGLQNSSAELIIGVDSDETTDCEITHGRRQRIAVDYKKLYVEMFGKDAPANDQISEDEDWGPAKRKRREKESDAATTLMTLCESEKKCPNVNAKEVIEKLPSGHIKRSFFRIPPNAVEKLRLVFAENELPSRAVKENLSKQLGIETEKVNKWFKNARYLALKARKAERGKPFDSVSPKFSKESGSESGKHKTADQMASKDMPSATGALAPKNLKKLLRRKNRQSLISSLKKKQHRRDLLMTPAKKDKACMEFSDDVSLKSLKANVRRERKRVNFRDAAGVQEAEAELERLCKVKSKVEKLQQVLLGLPDRRSNKVDTHPFIEKPVIYVPVAELREKI